MSPSCRLDELALHGVHYRLKPVVRAQLLHETNMDSVEKARSDMQAWLYCRIQLLIILTILLAMAAGTARLTAQTDNIAVHGMDQSARKAPANVGT